MSKRELVLDHLKRHKEITSWEAIVNYKATRLSAIIFDLRDLYNIETIMEENEEGIRYARYVYLGEKFTKM